MIAPLKIPNGYLTMTYGHGDEIQGRCKNPTTTIQFVCDDVVPEGVGVSQCLNDIPVDVPDEELNPCLPTRGNIVAETKFAFREAKMFPSKFRNI